MALKIVHLFNHSSGSRYHAMISQGLLAHPLVDASFAMPVVSLGEVVKGADTDLCESLIAADYIFRPNDAHFIAKDWDAFLDTNRLWHKVVYYDKKDSPDIDMHRLETCVLYIKRSWTIGFDRMPPPLPPRPILPMDYCVLQEYITADMPQERDIDVACLFNPSPKLGKRRYNLLSEVIKERKQLGRSAIGEVTASGRQGRKAVFEKPQGNPFIAYLGLLRRSRIVFTAYPDNWDGDSRTWEAFASGALVFMDATSIPSPYPLLDQEHCFVYDARSSDSIREAIALAKELLRDENRRSEIARKGYEHALSWHRPINRIDLILSWLNSRNKRLDHLVHF